MMGKVIDIGNIIITPKKDDKPAVVINMREYRRKN